MSGVYLLSLQALVASSPTASSSASSTLRPTTSAFSTARWLVRGIGGELLTNVAGRGGPGWRRAFRGQRVPPMVDSDVAIVSGATGGIGAEVSMGLASRGYHVIIAARDRHRGEQLVSGIRASGGSAEFAELHMDSAESAAAFPGVLRGRPCALLVNNAGVMSVGKGLIMRTNFLGPALLTTALLPSLKRHPSPRVVNVGSSSHLRALRVDASTLSRVEVDGDLRAYAQSKLALMQFSTLMRQGACGCWLEVVDAHPGLVWTPMLQRHWGRLAPVLERLGISRLLFKSSECGAATVLAAALAPRVPPPQWGERSRWTCGWRDGPYFVNQRPGGFASVESRDVQAARAAWAAMVARPAGRLTPEGCRELGLPA